MKKMMQSLGEEVTLRSGSDLMKMVMDQQFKIQSKFVIGDEGNNVQGSPRAGVINPVQSALIE